MVVVCGRRSVPPSSANTGTAVMTASSSPKRRARIVTSDEDLLAPCGNQELTRLVGGGATPITGLRPLSAVEPRIRRVT